MQPGSEPRTRLQFSNFNISASSEGYEVKLLQNRDPKILDVSGGSFTVGHNATFYSADSLTLLARDVIIDGAFNVTNVTRMRNLTARVDFLRISGTFGVAGSLELHVDNLEIIGSLEIEDIVSIRGRTAKRTATIFVNTMGSLTMNSRNSPGVSSVRASVVEVNGTFAAGIISTAEEWNILRVLSKGRMNMDVRGEFKVNSLLVSGNLEFKNKVSIVSSTLTIYKDGSLKLTSGAYNVSCSRKDVFSEIRADRILVDGLLQAGPLSVGDGINIFKVGPSGDFQFYPVGSFSFDSFTVDGKMSSFGDVVLQGKTNDTLQHAKIGANAKVVLKRCFGRSQIKAERVTVAGVLSTDLLSIAPYWRELLVLGTFDFLPSEPFNITTTTISGIMRTIKPFSRDTSLLGDSLTILPTGVLHMNFKRKLTDFSSGSPPSTIRMNTLSVGGRLETGSLEVFAGRMEVSASGIVTANWGGYVGAEGPGAGSLSHSGGSGASHGGRGGRGRGTTCHNLPYGSIYLKGTWGSGGGGGYRGYRGGRGGGKVFLEIESSLKLDGTIQASGEAGKVRLGFLFITKLGIFHRLHDNTLQLYI